MLHEISELKNLGKFENIKEDVKIEENCLIFGFNGTGKSTLSDMFYSMSSGTEHDLETIRATLKRECEIEEKKIYIRLKTDDGDIEYKNGQWSKKLDVITFNERYVDETVMIAEKLKNNVAESVFSKEANRLTKKKQKLEESMQNEYIPMIKDCLINKSNIFKDIKNIGAVKTLTKRSGTKIAALSALKLYSESEQEKISEELEKNSVYYEKKNKIEECIERYNKIASKSIGNVIKVERIEKLLRKIPRTSSKMLTEHINKYMKKNNLTWLLAGYYNQKDSEICPYCGQKLDVHANKLIKEIERFISMKNMENAGQIRTEVEDVLAIINYKKIMEAVLGYNDIIHILIENEILTKAERQQYEIELNVAWLQYCICNLEKTLWEKRDNVFEKINLTEEEKELIACLNKIFIKLSKMDRLLDDLLNKYEKRMLNDKEQGEKGAILLLSNGKDRNEVLDAIEAAKKYVQAEKEIQEINVALDDISGNVKMDKINNYLNELNVKYKIFMKNKRFYVKLKDFAPEEYRVGVKTKTLFSEGERRALAFAYFMSELEGQKNCIVVLDDPICSLDMNRKSIMAYQISNMMKKKENQIIILTHDISFAERITGYYEKKNGQKPIVLQKYELTNKMRNFKALALDDYLKTDSAVYEELILNAMGSNSRLDKVLGLMSIRPYIYLKGCKGEEYKKIEMATTYFTHTSYAQAGRVKFRKNDYSVRKMQKLLKQVKTVSKLDIKEKEFISEDFVFEPFTYEELSTWYRSISLETVEDSRKKALLMRPMLEASVVRLVKKSKIDAEHIGEVYGRATRNSDKKVKEYAIKLQELYNITCKYHHGAEEGSTLGISWINSDEVEYMDEELIKVMNYIDMRDMVLQSA